MKRKKRYEQQLEQLHGTLTTIETQREALENANTNAAVLDTMKGAADALKKTHKDMNVDNVHEMMDDIAEQNDVANEISQAISTGIIGTGVDDDELAKELEELEQEELDKDLLNVGPGDEQASRCSVYRLTESIEGQGEEERFATETMTEISDDSQALCSCFSETTGRRRRHG